MSLQLRLQTTTNEQLKHCWAFAIDTKKARSKRARSMKSCVINACSHEAKLLGVRAGMLYEEARLLIPGLRVIVCNW